MAVARGERHDGQQNQLAAGPETARRPPQSAKTTSGRAQDWALSLLGWCWFPSSLFWQALPPIVLQSYQQEHDEHEQ